MDLYVFDYYEDRTPPPPLRAYGIYTEQTGGCLNYLVPYPETSRGCEEILKRYNIEYGIVRSVPALRTTQNVYVIAASDINRIVNAMEIENIPKGILQLVSWTSDVWALFPTYEQIAEQISSNSLAAEYTDDSDDDDSFWPMGESTGYMYDG